MRYEIRVGTTRYRAASGEDLDRLVKGLLERGLRAENIEIYIMQ